MLAYVFWHYSAVDPSLYETRLVAFHRALQSTKPDGFVRSAVYQIQGAPWLPRSTGYEDWYEVEDWAALGALNTAAVFGQVGTEHNAVARLADGGTAGLYRRERQAAEPMSQTASLWFAKPRETSYPEFTARFDALPVGCTVWQRQMVLGPTPEFCIAGPEAAVAGLRLPFLEQARLVSRRPVF